MSTAREEILARVRSALRDVPPAESAADVPVPREYRRRRAPHTDVVELFAERVEHYRASVLTVAADAVPEAIAASLVANGTSHLVVPADLRSDWLTGVDVTTSRDAGDLDPGQLDQADTVLTGCAVGIADTGTIVLDAGPAQGRRALSLIPDHHLCVVLASQVVGTVPEALARLDPGNPLTWISGPSATSDIELSRVEGVHGPRALEVLLVRDDRQGRGEPL